MTDVNKINKRAAYQPKSRDVLAQISPRVGATCQVSSVLELKICVLLRDGRNRQRIGAKWSLLRGLNSDSAGVLKVTELIRRFYSV